MRVLKERKEMSYAIKWFARAAEEAEKSTCHRKKCGTVIVKNNRIIGRGYNSPPGDKTLKKCLKDSLPKNFKSDKTCCIHAEQRAIMDALRHFPTEVEGSTLYFVRINEKNNIEHSGRPYCTICSKMALDAKVRRFVLWHEKGITSYTTDEYNKISFRQKRWGVK